MELDDLASVLANSDFFRICDVEQRRLLAFASEQRSFKAGDYLYRRGDVSQGAYVLVSGSVLAGEGDAADKLHRLDEPGTVLGELGLVLERPRRSSMKAESDVQGLFVPRSAFVKLMRQYPDMAERAAAHVALELDEFLGTMSAFGQRDGLR